MRQTFWISGGDHGSVVLGTGNRGACRGIMVRRVHCVHTPEEVGGVGLTTCVSSWVSHSASRTCGKEQ